MKRNVPALFLLLLFCVLWAGASERRRQRLELARAHYRRVRNGLKCDEPRPRVVNVPGKMLLPPATVLHRCGKSAGCCKAPEERCVPKTRERVKLYFLERTFEGRRKVAVREMTFVNHTRCHCRDLRHIPR